MTAGIFQKTLPGPTDHIFLRNPGLAIKNGAGIIERRLLTRSGRPENLKLILKTATDFFELFLGLL